MKKTLSLFLTLIMALSVISVAGTAVSAAEAATVNNVDCSVGNTVTFTYDLKTPDKVEDFQGQLNYSSGLELVDFQLSETEGTMTTTNIPNVVYYSGTSASAPYDFTTSSTLITAKFKVTQAGAQTIENKMYIISGVNGVDYYIKGTNNGTTESTNTTVDIVPAESVVLDKTALTMNVGETQTITATVNPELTTDKTVTWTTSDPEVATVDNGTVTAVKSGSATITAKCGDASATCEVKVNQPVTSVKLNAATRTIYTGKTFTLKATVAPANATDKTVKWTTSNKNVATVTSKGVVKGVRPGTATITATCGGKKAACKFTVKQLVTSIKLNAKAKIVYSGKTFTLKATVSPKNASNKTVAWTTLNKKVATVTSRGVVKGIKGGTTYVRATAKDGSKKYAQCKVTVRQSATKLTLSATKLTVKKGKTKSVKATLYPSNVYNKKISVKANNKNVKLNASYITSKKSVKITGKKAGKSTVTFSAVDGSRKSARCTVTVKK